MLLISYMVICESAFPRDSRRSMAGTGGLEDVEVWDGEEEDGLKRADDALAGVMH